MNKNQVAVSVKTLYLDKDSNPDDNQYVFAYQITITNTGTNNVQLFNRHWHIVDANNKEDEVVGDGVVGEQPYFMPNQEYSYSSGVVLETPTGSMRGYYGMANDEGENFQAVIPEFLLLGPRTLH